MTELLRMENVTAGYGTTPVIQGINLTLRRNEILGIVGESGCGKSTLLKAVAQVRGMGVSVMGGRLFLQGRDMATLSDGEKRRIHGEQMAMIFQNASASLHPTRTVRTQCYETLRAHGDWDTADMDALIAATFRSIGLHDVERIVHSYPYALSGGMAQRVAMALAMLLKPQVLLADEPTSALDTTVQKQVIDELLRLRDTLHTGMLIVTHNMGVVSYMTDTVAVMYGGRIMEYGPTREVLSQPMHPYTRALLGAVPRLGGQLPQGLPGRIAPSDGKLGCVFRDRCIQAVADCQTYDGQPQTTGQRYVACCEEARSKGGIA